MRQPQPSLAFEIIAEQREQEAQNQISRAEEAKEGIFADESQLNCLYDCLRKVFGPEKGIDAQLRADVAQSRKEEIKMEWLKSANYYNALFMAV